MSLKDKETERRTELLIYKKKVISIISKQNMNQNVLINIRKSLCILTIKKIIWFNLHPKFHQVLEDNGVNLQLARRYKNKRRKKNKILNKTPFQLIYTPMGNKR